MSPAEFEERYAAYLLEGQGHTREFVAAVIAEIRNLVPNYLQSKTETKLPERYWTQPEDLIPAVYRDKPKRRRDRIYAADPQAVARLLNNGEHRQPDR